MTRIMTHTNVTRGNTTHANSARGRTTHTNATGGRITHTLGHKFTHHQKRRSTLGITKLLVAAFLLMIPVAASGGWRDDYTLVVTGQKGERRYTWLVDENAWVCAKEPEFRYTFREDLWYPSQGNMTAKRGRIIMPQQVCEEYSVQPDYDIFFLEELGSGCSAKLLPRAPRFFFKDWSIGELKKFIENEDLYPERKGTYLKRFTWHDLLSIIRACKLFFDKDLSEDKQERTFRTFQQLIETSYIMPDEEVWDEFCILYDSNEEDEFLYEIGNRAPPSIKALANMLDVDLEELLLDTRKAVDEEAAFFREVPVPASAHLFIWECPIQLDIRSHMPDPFDFTSEYTDALHEACIEHRGVRIKTFGRPLQWLEHHAQDTKQPGARTTSANRQAFDTACKSKLRANRDSSPEEDWFGEEALFGEDSGQELEEEEFGEKSGQELEEEEFGEKSGQELEEEAFDEESFQNKRESDKDGEEEFNAGGGVGENGNIFPRAKQTENIKSNQVTDTDRQLAPGEEGYAYNKMYENAPKEATEEQTLRALLKKENTPGAQAEGEHHSHSPADPIMFDLSGLSQLNDSEQVSMDNIIKRTKSDKWSWKQDSQSHVIELDTSCKTVTFKFPDKFSLKINDKKIKANKSYNVKDITIVKIYRIRRLRFNKKLSKYTFTIKNRGEKAASAPKENISGMFDLLGKRLNLAGLNFGNMTKLSDVLKEVINKASLPSDKKNKHAVCA